MTESRAPSADAHAPHTALPAAPVVPRPAASLLVLRETPDGAEVLMGLRGAGHRFMPNRLVFPGGAVDPDDFAAPVASEMAAHVRRRLSFGAGGADLAHALGVAAARELQEETGLTLGTPPALDGLDYLCRAVTPPASPVRFDARFLVVDAARVSGALAGSGELEGLRFYKVADAMALDLALATRHVFDKLLEWRAMTPEERRTQARVAVLHNRAWVWETDEGAS
jgi:8-oxo-dGTP pyrophosphatase MutT (NUDIX family)